MTGQPQTGVVEFAVLFVQDGEDVTGGACPGEEAEFTFTDERPTALVAADELDNIDAGFPELAEGECPTFAPQRRVLVVLNVLPVRHETVQVDA